jgi:hypothetical protein
MMPDVADLAAEAHLHRHDQGHGLDNDMTNFANADHAFIVGRVLERLRACGNNVRAVTDADGNATDTIQIEVGIDTTLWVDLVVQPWT